MNRDNTVGIVTPHELDGLGIENPGGSEFSCIRPDWPWCPVLLLCNVYWLRFPWVKQPVISVDHQLTFSNEVKERVYLYLYSPARSSWLVIGSNLPSYVYSMGHGTLCVYLIYDYVYISESIPSIVGWSEKDETEIPFKQAIVAWSKYIRKSDVWLTVHRNSAWIRKTN